MEAPRYLKIAHQGMVPWPLGFTQRTSLTLYPDRVTFSPGHRYWMQIMPLGKTQTHEL